MNATRHILFSVFLQVLFVAQATTRTADVVVRQNCMKKGCNACNINQSMNQSTLFHTCKKRN